MVRLNDARVKTKWIRDKPLSRALVIVEALAVRQTIIAYRTDRIKRLGFYEQNIDCYYITDTTHTMTFIVVYNIIKILI